CMQALEFPHTF
nr:immunoglobulin light chain junction region [Macaca mulatta]MOX98877.1 immunoglobulin light chain junction region [Macaca mulatta]MOY01127.1 immunoglobulin light chain junction region [Macaca mulatta]